MKLAELSQDVTTDQIDDAMADGYDAAVRDEIFCPHENQDLVRAWWIGVDAALQDRQIGGILEEIC
jgi:hypothetical protein